MSARKGLQEDHLQMLIETGAAREFLVQRTEAGGQWMLSVRIGVRWIPLRSRREATRTWANLQTLALYLGALGVRSFGVEQ